MEAMTENASVCFDKNTSVFFFFKLNLLGVILVNKTI